jgi:hypothetical protein
MYNVRDSLTVFTVLQKILLKSSSHCAHLKSVSVYQLGIPAPRSRYPTLVKSFLPKIPHFKFGKYEIQR